MFSRFVTWLKGLPERMRHWPELIVEWCTDRFWDFVDFVRDLPRRTRQFLIDLAKAFRDLWILFAEWFFQSIASLFQFTIKAIAYPFILLQTRLDPHPSTVPPARLRISSRGRKISIFSRQLASMTQGGVPLVQSLDVLSDQNEDPKLGYVAKEIANKLTQGYSLSKAVSLYPKVFPSIFPYLVRAGESTGRLVNVIDRLAYGAVADFLNMSCCGINNPFAFNVADIAIFAGALGLVLFPASNSTPQGKNAS